MSEKSEISRMYLRITETMVDGKVKGRQSNVAESRKLCLDGIMFSCRLANEVTLRKTSASTVQSHRILRK
jgi:hypothetical protein